MNYTMFQRHTQSTSHKKKLSSEPSGKGFTFPSKNVTGKDILYEYEMPISFQASVATSQDTFLKTP